MTTIDQRILIPSPPDTVWEYISDIRNNPRWQADCTSVVFLTSKVTGPGTRWRQSMAHSSEQVIEIAAWYEGLGYQYTYIDGMPFRESSGRLRLQEIPEGTVVQWTITYEVGGLFGGVRSSLGLNRKLESMMVTSLKSLWKQISESGAAKRQYEAKSLIREAPDAEARATYKPRHTPVVDIRAEGEDRAATKQPEPQAVVQEDNDAKFRPPASHPIPEPPVADDDTKPRRPVEPAHAAEPPRLRGVVDHLEEDTEEPEFLQDMARFAPPTQVEAQADDTQPVAPVTAEPDIMAEFTLDESDFAPREPASPASSEAADASLTDEINAIVYQPESWEEPDDEPFPELRVIEEQSSLLDEPQATAKAETPKPSVTDEIDALIADVEADIKADDDGARQSADLAPVNVEPEAPASADKPATGEPTEELKAETPASDEHKIDESAFPPPAATDTSGMSIWEVFGVPRPSETGEVAAADAPPSVLEEASAPESDAQTVEQPVETGETLEPVEKAETPAEPIAEATPSLLDDIPMPDMTTSTGELVIVEVVREVSASQRRTGLRVQMRQKATRLRKPD